MKKLLYLVYIFLIIITIKFIYNISMNSILIEKYKEDEYLEDKAKALTTINFPQSYIAYYNYGNILYKNEKYENAITQYKKALKVSMPRNKECKVRINYALAICETVEVDEKKQEEIKEAIEKYESAIDVLTEEGCANREDDDGHSKKAQKLKNDIQKEIDRLKKLQEDDEEEEDDNNQDDENEEPEEEEVENIEEKIRNLREDAIREQRSLEDDYRYFNNYNFNTPKINW